MESLGKALSRTRYGSRYAGTNPALGDEKAGLVLSDRVASSDVDGDLAELAEKYRSEPVNLSDELRKKLGILQEPIDGR